MEIDPAEGARIKANWLKRREEQEQAERALQEEAWQKAQAVAAWLKSEWSVGKVYLYGSLAGEGRFDHLSDIDLYIQGLSPAKNFWRMLAEAMERAQPFPISIVVEENALPSLREKVKKRGIEL